MAKSKKVKPLTKAEIILAHITEHPKATNQQIVADLKAKGIHTHVNYVAIVRTERAKKKKGSKRSSEAQTTVIRPLPNFSDESILGVSMAPDYGPFTPRRPKDDD